VTINRKTPVRPRSVSNVGSRRADIQGLRAVAILFVVMFHAGLPMPGGFVGVDVFFVISGFVIASMLRREWERTGRIRFGNFYARRFRRLTPALAVMVSVVAISSTLIVSPFGTQQVTGQTGLGAMLLFANVVIQRTTGNYFDAAAELNPLLNTWSLSVEEQFYLAFPVIILTSWMLARRFHRLRTAPVLMVAALGVVSFTISLATSAGLYSLPILGSFTGFYSPVTRVWEFAAGALLAVGLTSLNSLPPRIPRAVPAIGAGMLVASLWVITGDTPYPGLATLLPVSGTLLILIGGLDSTNPVNQWLAVKPMTMIGDLSYSWYLWHWPMIVFAVTLWPLRPLVPLAAACVSLLPAIFSFRWVERPIRAQNSLTTGRMTGLVVATLVPSIVLSFLLWRVADNGYWSAEVRSYESAVSTDHVDNLAGCHKGALPTSRPSGECRWNSGGVSSPIYLVGDSHGDHISDAVVESGRRNGRPVSIFTDQCPFVDVFIWESGRLNEHCRTYVRGMTSWLENQPNGLVIIANSDAYWREDSFAVGANGRSGSTDPTQKIGYFQPQLRSTVEELTRAGQRVLIVQDVPKFDGYYEWDPRGCPMLSVLRHTCRKSMPISYVEGNQRATRTAIDEVAAQTGASVLDVRPLFCPNAVCVTQIGDKYLYRDGGHLSVPANSLLIPAFTRAMNGR
jgi:peptidoglycan/LPS O-acetylase OafA/YrhL